MRALREELQIPEFQFDQISQLDAEDLDAEDLVRKIASTKELRAITRLIPSHLALLAMNIVQWVPAFIIYVKIIIINQRLYRC